GLDLRDDYGRLLEGNAPRGVIREGGDAEGVGPGGEGLAATSHKTVALFQGPVTVGADGSAKITLDIPDFEGQLRLMAVAYGHNAAGQGEAKLIIRDPVIADLSLPRFLAPGDTARLAVHFHNTDGAAGTYHLSVAADGAARVKLDHPLDETLGAGEQALDTVMIEGLDEGVSTIRTDITGPNAFAVHREWQIAVRAAHFPIVLEQMATQEPGQSFHIEPRGLKALLPGSISVNLSYSGFAGIDPPSLLQSLYRYPYGCTEQLSSSAFPLVYFNDPGLLGGLPKDEGVKERVQRAIDTILDRQGVDGRFGLWRVNDREGSTWLNVYALDFLLHASEAHFVVPEAALKRSYAWIQNSLNQLDGDYEGYYSEAPDTTRAYAFYVLARAGQVDPAKLRYAHDTIDLAPRTGSTIPVSYWHGKIDEPRLAEPLSLGQLAGALSLIGDKARARASFDRAVGNLALTKLPYWWYYNTYYSEIRDLAGLIAISAEIGDQARTASLIQRLKDQSLTANQLTTQEKAWLLAAAHALNNGTAPVKLVANGQAINQAKLPLVLTPSVADINAGYTVENRGAQTLYRTLVIRGAPKLAPSGIDAGYHLKKSYLGLTGAKIDPAHRRQNDRFIISLEGDVADDERHRTALVDLLPSGWEIESVVTVNDHYPFLGSLTIAQNLEARDDRFVAAFDLGTDQSRGYQAVNDSDKDEESQNKSLAPSQFHLAYLVRVVTPGHFTLPEAVVEDMYHPGLMGRTDAGETSADPR
ncbi:MAG TPA: alpha-2-macroglobulin family protein, partial [Stellaceae bacterium]|nr:alpha-2-macroglobulin family protein [Stellaceae bacterium]